MGEPRAPVRELRFHGGLVGALAPFGTFLLGVAALAIQGAPSERGFWPVLVASLFVAMLLARDRTAWAEAAVAAMARPVVVLMVLAWLLAGALGAVLGASGLIESLVWIAEGLGLTGGGFVVGAFLACCVVSTSTGTSLGTVILAAPLLYPAGGPLGADPAMLMGAILGGSTFGDNVSPVSDTTIASAYSQGARMADVVRSRMKYALPAAAVALLGSAVLGGAEGAAEAGAVAIESSPAGLPMLLSPALVIVVLLRGGHLLAGLLVGLGSAAALGLATGRLASEALISIDAASFTARGLLVEGLDRGVGVSVFTLLLMGVVSSLDASGLTARAIALAEARTSSRASAERWTVGTVSLATLLITHSTVAILTVGSFTRRMGERFGVGANRRANLLDVTVCSWPHVFPFFIPAILTASTTASGAGAGLPRLTSFQVGLANLHSWALLGMVLIAVLFGYGGTDDDPTTDDPAHGEPADAAGHDA